MPEHHASSDPGISSAVEPPAGSATADRWPRAGRLLRLLADPANVVPLLLILGFAARAAWLDQPPGALIFDEAYYVNAARVVAGLPVEAGAHYAGSPVGLDPNLEHPPLGKALIAGSMELFGDGPLGWRLPSLVAGMIALAAAYLMARATGASAWLAAMILGLLAFDNLMLVHGRIATLDMLALAPMLVGAWLALRERWLLAGAAMAVGFLVKLTALYGMIAIGLWLGLRLWSAWREDGRLDGRPIAAGLASLAAFAVVALGGLWLLDLRFTTFATPLEHIGHMVSYGASLTETPDRSGVCAGASSVPWQWPFNECQINYLRTDVTRPSGERFTTVDFRGAMNPLLASATPLATLASVWLAWRRADPLARWAVVWAAATFLPYVALTLVGHRVAYIYYVLPVVPGLAIFVVLLLTRAGLPRSVLWAYLVAYAIGFAAYFPFRQIP